VVQEWVVQEWVVQEWAGQAWIDRVWDRVAIEVPVMAQDAMVIGRDAKAVIGLRHRHVMRVLDPRVNKVDALLE
jgi:hypothetical protein